MVLKTSSVLSCLLPARLGFGSNHAPDSPSRLRNQEKHTNDHHRPAGLAPRDRLGDPELDPFRGNPLPLYRAPDSDFRTHPSNLSRARANTQPSYSMPRTPNGDIGESPGPPNRSLASQNRQKRSSCTTFFAFSSKRKSTHGAPIIHIPPLQQDLLVPPNSVSGRWVSDSGQTQVHLINPSSLPSPLQADDDEYYYSYYASLTPIPSPRPDISPSKSLSSRQQDLVGIPDLNSQRSSPVASHLSHTHIRHPYAYSAPRCSITHANTVDTAPPLRHATSQPFHRHPQDSRFDVDTGPAHGTLPPSHFGYETPQSQPGLLQRQLKMSMSTPNLAAGAAPGRSRSLIKKKPPRSKAQERWLSAETWWDALLSPSPRFKVKQAVRPHTATSRNIHDPPSKFVQGEPSRNLGVTFPSVPAPRPRAASATSVTSNVGPIYPTLPRSRSTADLRGQSSTSATPRPGFEPALETLADESTPMADQVPGSEAELPLPDPPLSLEQVIDQGEAFEQQRAQWKQQASKSLGNKHTRSFSRARSKSLGSRHAHGHPTSESSKPQFNLEFLAARTLLGSQSTMPTVHITTPSNSSSHSKAYSHSHSQSAYSYSHTSHSHTHSHSHSHSHSLTTSNSSKSSRNLLSRGHSRKGSWSKPAFLKAGVLCGVSQDEPYGASADERVPSSSRIDVQGTIHIVDSTNAGGAVSPFQSIPAGEVGIAITSSPALEGCFDLKVPGHPFVSGPRHQEGDQEGRWPPKYTQNSSGYAGPHPSVIDSNLPPLGATNGVSLRHRLPPRAAIHPPIALIAHPYRSASAQPEQVGDNSSEGATSKVSESQGATEPTEERTYYPHISLSHADFEQYGVGEALVYASHPRPEEVAEAEQTNVESTSSLAVPPEEQSSSRETVVLQPEEPDTSSLAMNSPPSLTNSTIRMVMSGLDDPEDLDEFQDLFYKPHLASGAQQQESSVTISQVPTDVHSSASSSPLTHLVRKLSERAHNLRDPSRTPSDPTRLQTSESQDHHSNDGETKFVFTDLARSSSSLPHVESSSQVHLPIQKGSESVVQPFMVIPEDVNSSYTASVLESPLDECENDTFGYPIKHGQLETATTSPPIQTPLRLSTHLSIQEDVDVEDENAFLSPVTRRFGLSSVDVVRASYMTTSDVSQMSALSDFPLPPSARPGGLSDHISILQARFEATPLAEPQDHDQREDEADVGQEDRPTEGDVDQTLQALRMSSRVTSFESHRSTFGGSEDMDFITQLHQARP